MVGPRLTIKEETLFYAAAMVADVVVELARRTCLKALDRKDRRNLPEVDKTTKMRVRLALVVPLRDCLISMGCQVE